MHDAYLALIHLFEPWPLFLLVLGTSLGVTVGAVPGLTGAMLIALTLPLTYSMRDPNDAMVLLVSMYVGSISGGLISATLLRMPGTPASMMTTLDGYPMAQAGRPGRALGLGINSSFVGGMVSWLFLLLLAKPMSEVSILLGKMDYFALVVMSLVLIASVSGGNLARGILAGFLGLLAALPGTSPATGDVRLTFGFSQLDAGLQLLPVLIGLFAVGQIINDILNINQKPKALAFASGGILLSLDDLLRHGVNLLRSSLIGTWVGILPGIGANVGSALAYTAAKNFSRHPEEFGHGSEEGVVASEAANNATVGGALIPLVSMGIPGSVIDAILLSAMVLQGLTPGLQLFKDNPGIVYTIIFTTLLSNIFMFVFMLSTVRILSRLMYIPRAYMLPILLVLCVIGAYTFANRWFDVWVMLGFGLLGFTLDRLKIPLAPFVIGFVLAGIAEENLGAGLMLSGGSYWPLFDPRRPAVYFLALSVVMLCWPLYRAWRRTQAEKETEP
ncbi:MAG: tripartite tricarboxylate transporter permease [Pirellulaceae bacterium]